MKTEMILTIFWGTLILIGCEFKQPIGDIGDSPDKVVDPPSINIEYDNQMVTQSYKWPASTVTGTLGKTTGEEDKVYLVDFANTHTSISIDNQGYIYMKVEWLEGNSDIQMPEQMWEDIKDKTNPFNPKSIPIVAYEYDHGTYSTFDKNGGVIYSLPYEADSLRLDINLFNPDEFARAMDSLNLLDSTSNRTDEIIESLESQGLSYSLLADTKVLVDNHTEHGILKQVIDLKTGKVDREATYNDDGNLDLATFYSYDYSSHFPLPVQTTTYEVERLLDGTRGVVRRTTETKSNISFDYNGKEENKK